MAKVKNPFFSLVASGTFAGIMTANRGQNGQIMRSAPLRKINGLSKAAISQGTPSQAARRTIMRDAIATWQQKTTAEKAPYNTRAKALQISGYNLFVKETLNNPPTPAGTIWDSGTTTWDSGSTSWDN